ncbi:hypothetical protein [Hymenobacter sp. UYCo722]|uniref:hypothetical protein n=1 Tax=Hymenobacter sp. UYCo722 TaxID=3156335 RepID=UPI00339A730E
MRQRLLSTLLLTALLGCSKSDSNPIMDFGEGEGITYRTANNIPIGPRDYTDWTSDGEWNKRERALFADLGLDLNGAQRPASVAYITLYPNPMMGDYARWKLQTNALTSGSGGYTVSGVLVDRNYNVQQRFGPQRNILNTDYEINCVQLGLSPNELYRLYYVVSNASGLVYKGHGDIRYSPQ